MSALLAVEVEIRPPKLYIYIYIYTYTYTYIYIYHSVGRGGGTPERSPHPKSEKLLQQSGVIFEGYILAKRSQNQRNIP